MGPKPTDGCGGALSTRRGGHGRLDVLAHGDGILFTARVWGKLLIGLPPPTAVADGVCSNTCGYIQFQQQAFDQLVLAEDKKELIRAVARSSGDDGNDDEETVGLDVVANKGRAKIFLLHGPPGCGKTLSSCANRCTL